MIELTITLDHIDYNDLARLLLPMLEDKLSGEGLAGRLLLDPARTQALVKELLNRMSQKQKDELLVKYVNQNSSKAIGKLEDIAEKNGVTLRLSGISAKTL